MTELEKVQTALFVIVRNNTVMPEGLRLGKSMSEINRMSYETMLKVCEHIDVNSAFESFKRARQSYLDRSKTNGMDKC